MAKQLIEVSPHQVKHGDVIYGQALPDVNYIAIGEVVGNAKPQNTKGTLWRIHLSRSSTARFIDVPGDRKVRIHRKGQSKDIQ